MKEIKTMKTKTKPKAQPARATVTATPSPVDFAPFCAVAEGKTYDLTTPFVLDDGYEYATDGAVAVRRNTTQKPTTGRAVPRCNQLFERGFSFPHGGDPWPHIRVSAAADTLEMYRVRIQIGDNLYAWEYVQLIGTLPNVIWWPGIGGDRLHFAAREAKGTWIEGVLMEVRPPVPPVILP